MRKLLIAGVVAAMVFGSAAFAASFQLNDSVLAVGDADVQNCYPGGDSETWLDIVSWPTAHPATSGDEYMTRGVTFNSEHLSNCGDDELIFIALYDEAGNRFFQNPGVRVGDVKGNEQGGDATFVEFSPPQPTADIWHIKVLIHTRPLW